MKSIKKLNTNSEKNIFNEVIDVEGAKYGPCGAGCHCRYACDEELTESGVFGSAYALGVNTPE